MQTLSRGLSVLDIIAEQEVGISVTELAHRLDISPSIASRMLKTLAESGYISQGLNSRRYYLAEKVVWLSHSYFQHVPLRKPLKPILQALVDQTNETSHLAILMNNSALVLEDVESKAMLRVYSEVGRIVPLHCTAIGKCLMAFHQLDLPEQLESYTQHTITDHEQLSAQMETIRAQGFAVDDEEFNVGVRCLAAPVFDTNGKAIAAIGISGPTARVERDKIQMLGDIVMAVAQQTSKILFSESPG